MVDYRQLKEARPAVWTEGGAKSASIGRDMDQYAEDVGKYANDLDRAWQGNDAVAARHSIMECSRDYVQAQVAFTAMGEVLSRLAHDVSEAQKILGAAEDYAARVPATIHPDGSVTADPPPEARRSDGWMASIQKGVEAVADEIERALELANKADRDAAKALAAIKTPEAPNVDPLTALQNRPEGENGQPPTPEENKKWWDGLTEEEQESLKNEYPGIIGNTDGIPTTDRDDANRVTLDYAREKADADLKKAGEDLRALMTDEGPNKLQPGDPRLQAAQDRYDAALERKNALDGLDKRLNDPTKDRAYLLALDTQGNGKAAVAVGNPDTAKNVATYVPGTGGGLNTGYLIDVDRADAMRRDAGKDTATIAWQGYDAPQWNLPGPADDSYYKKAPEAVRDFQQGLRATHQGEPSNNTIMGHSYGATVVSHAAQKYDLGVQNVVQIASPGEGATQDVHGYKGHPPPTSWATEAPGDPVGDLGVHGQDATSDYTRNRQFDSDGNNPITAHTGYWDRSNQFRDHIRDIITGNGDRVPYHVGDWEPPDYSVAPGI